MRRGELAIVFLLVAAGAALVAGCGGSDDNTTTVTTPAASEDTKPIPKAEYISRADEICAKSHEIVAPLEDEYQAALKRRDYQEAADKYEEGSTVAGRQLEQIKALPEPSEEAGVASTIESKGDAQHALAVQFGEALRDEDIARARTLGEELKGLQRELEGITIGYGFKECGQND